MIPSLYFIGKSCYILLIESNRPQGGGFQNELDYVPRDTPILLADRVGITFSFTIINLCFIVYCPPTNLYS